MIKTDNALTVIGFGCALIVMVLIMAAVFSAKETINLADASRLLLFVVVLTGIGSSLLGAGIVLWHLEEKPEEETEENQSPKDT